MLNKIFLSI